MSNPNGLSVNINPAAIMGGNTGLAPNVDVNSIVPPNDPPARLTPQQKENWNRFIQFVKDNKMAGNPDLDRRDKSLGLGLLQKFNATYPTYKIDPAMIPQVQQEFHNVRDDLIKQYKTNPKAFDGSVKSEADIMPKISKVDGWPGTETLGHQFPVGVLKTINPQGVASLKSFGTDIAALDRTHGGL